MKDPQTDENTLHSCYCASK